MSFITHTEIALRTFLSGTTINRDNWSDYPRAYENLSQYNLIIKK